MFQETLPPILQEQRTAERSVFQPVPERPVRLFCQDESRLGRLPIQRRRLTLTGVTPVGTGPYCVETFDVYGAVEPTTGERLVLERPYLHAPNVQLFLKECSPGSQETRTIVLRDNGSGHTANALVIPPTVVGLVWPPSRPELHPIERRWRERKDQLAWRLVGTRGAWAHHVERLITHATEAAMRSLTSYP